MGIAVASKTDWLRVFLLWGAGLGAAAQYGKVSVIFDQLPSLYPDAGALLGWAVSLVGGVGIVLGIVAGLTVSRLGLRRALIWGLWLGAAMSALQALGPPLWLFLATRLIEGVSHLAIVVAAPTLIASLSAARDRGLTLTIWGTFFGVAFAILAWLGLPLVARTGVASLFLCHSAFMALAAVVLGRVLATDMAPAEPPADTSAAARTPSAMGVQRLVSLHKQIYLSPRVSAPALGWLFYTFCFVSLLTLIPPYLDPAHRVAILGAMPLLSILCSMTLGVWLMRRMSSVSVIQIGFLTSAVCALSLLVWPGAPVLCLVFAAVLGLVQGASFAAVPDLNERADDRLLANGAMAQTGNIGNTLGTPVLFFASSAWGYGAFMGGMLFMLLLGAGAHAVLAWRRAAEYEIL